MDSRSAAVSGTLLGAPGFGVESGLANVSWSASRNTVKSAIFATQGRRAIGSGIASSSPMETVKVAAFLPPEAKDLGFRVSVDGRAFSALTQERREAKLPGLPGGPARGQSRRRVDYELPVPPGYRHLGIFWNGPAEIDRVEIYHP